MPTGERDVYWQEVGEVISTPVYANPVLSTDFETEGPVVFEFPHTTIVARPRQKVRVDRLGNILIDLKDEDRGREPSLVGANEGDR